MLPRQATARWQIFALACPPNFHLLAAIAAAVALSRCQHRTQRSRAVSPSRRRRLPLVFVIAWPQFGVQDVKTGRPCAAVAQSLYWGHAEEISMFMFRKKLEMPSAADALPRRPNPIPTAGTHPVLGTPLKQPY